MLFCLCVFFGTARHDSYIGASVAESLVSRGQAVASLNSHAYIYILVFDLVLFLHGPSQRNETPFTSVTAASV